MLALAFRTDAIKDLDPMVFKACNQQSVKMCAPLTKPFYNNNKKR